MEIDFYEAKIKEFKSIDNIEYAIKRKIDKTNRH